MIVNVYDWVDQAMFPHLGGVITKPCSQRTVDPLCVYIGAERERRFRAERLQDRVGRLILSQRFRDVLLIRNSGSNLSAKPSDFDHLFIASRWLLPESWQCDSNNEQPYDRNQRRLIALVFRT